ncbi:hypothetical protein CASFOL_035147 [Castilleja foliolosa]|uniref:Uncharacterized protein n=1 Tax=Castilleja foliolosa TaxID=1961234 RepID=A0ABD3BRS7_9LAMI
MGSTSTINVPLCERTWFMEVPELAEDLKTIPFDDEVIAELAYLKSYTTVIGMKERIWPDLLIDRIAPVFYWVPMNGLNPKRALDCIDGFIRCYRYRLATMTPEGWDSDDTRLASIVLGVSRAVMTRSYDLKIDDINAHELAAPLLSVSFPTSIRKNARFSPQYTVLIDNDSPHISMLEDSINLAQAEKELIMVIMRSAQAIIPIQGYNLINHGHHYLSEKTKLSNRAFLDMERQLWVSAVMKDMNETLLRDIIWHKAGYPVAIHIKEYAATSPAVKQHFVAAKLGSVAARLPAWETVIRTADTYVKLSEVVDSIWSTVGGSFNMEAIRSRMLAVKAMPRWKENLSSPVNMTGGVMLTSRTAAISALEDTMAKNADKMALAFGFFVAMTEDSSSDIGNSVGYSLMESRSLNRLKMDNIGSFFLGTELYKDYKAVRKRCQVELEDCHAA